MNDVVIRWCNRISIVINMTLQILIIYKCYPPVSECDATVESPKKTHH